MILVRTRCGALRYTRDGGLLRRGEDRCGDACCPVACVSNGWGREEVMTHVNQTDWKSSIIHLPLLPIHCMHSCCCGCIVGVKEVELGCTSQTSPGTHTDSPPLPALPSLRLRALPSRPDFTLCRREGEVITMQKKLQWRKNTTTEQTSHRLPSDRDVIHYDASGVTELQMTARGVRRERISSKQHLF